MIKQLKRRKSNLRGNSSESQESDDDEAEMDLPSVKRQRITMGAMRRLFSKFTIADPSSTSKNFTTNSSGVFPQKEATNENPFRLFTSRIASPINAEFVNQNHFPQPQAPFLNSINISSGTSEYNLDKRINSSTDGSSSINNPNRLQNIRSDEPSNEIIDRLVVSGSNFDSNGNSNTISNSNKLSNSSSVNSKERNLNHKRDAERSDEDEEPNRQESHRAKRVRQIKKGLRLCSSITCYIEQIIYNN